MTQPRYGHPTPLSSLPVSSPPCPCSTGSSAFSQTLQFITSVKLQELQHQSETFSKHVDDVINHASMAENDIDKVQKLLDGVKTWTGLGGQTTTDIPLHNIQLYVRPSYHPNRSSKHMSPDSRADALFIPGGSIRLRPILASPFSRSRTGVPLRNSSSSFGHPVRLCETVWKPLDRVAAERGLTGNWTRDL